MRGEVSPNGPLEGAPVLSSPLRTIWYCLYPARQLAGLMQVISVSRAREAIPQPTPRPDTSKEIRRSSQPCPRAVSHANLFASHRPSQARLDPEQAPSSVKIALLFKFGAARRVNLTQGIILSPRHHLYRSNISGASPPGTLPAAYQ